MQDLFIGYELFIRFANAYYSWSHQVMTLGLVVAIVLFAPWRNATRWASALLAQLPVAVMIYRFYPLMPPRLLDAEPPWGGRVLQIAPRAATDRHRRHAHRSARSVVAPRLCR